MFSTLIEKLFIWHTNFNDDSQIFYAENGNTYKIVRFQKQLILQYIPEKSLGYVTLLTFSTRDGTISQRSYVFPNRPSLELFSNPEYSNDFEYIYYKDDDCMDVDNIILSKLLDDDAFFQISTVTDLELDRTMLEDCIKTFDKFFSLSIYELDEFLTHRTHVISAL